VPDADRPPQCREVVSTEQLTMLKLAGAPPQVRLDGPALFDEARLPLEGYYT
jgi:hypothetical protein